MALSVNMNLAQKQKLVMTQTLREAIELLQTNAAELSERIEQELQENPVLEMQDASVSSDTLADQNSADIEALQAREQKLAVDADFGSGFEDSSDSGFAYSARAERDPDSKRQFLEGVPQRGQTLSEYLIGQLRLVTFTEEDSRIGEIIISSLDENGYLRRPLAELVELAPVPGRGAEDFMRVLELVKTLDPPGIAASDLRECLLLQLKDRDKREDAAARALAEAIVSDHFRLLEKRSWKQIASRLGVGADRVEEAARLIAGLEPLPGRRFAVSNIEYIVPDVIVREQDSEFVIHINDDFTPPLTISRTYRNLLRRKDTSAETKTYISEKLASAQWLIKSIEQRHETLFAVTSAILEEQQLFFRRGPGHLRPLTLRQIADRIGMHESTVSRVTTNKYVATPWGIFRLKYFFSSALQGENGQAASAQSVREMIRKIIEQEDGKLSDQEIVGILQNRGIRIARRTVAKYRKMQRILSSSKRHT
jgi:RNA polymerase sigma-54 factor